MSYTMIEIYNQEIKIGKDKYNFIIEEKLTPGFNRKPKFYTIKKNDKGYLYTTLHQTFYAYKRKLLNEVK